MANILGTSKNTLPNEKLYTEAEMELLKAMSLEEVSFCCAFCHGAFWTGSRKNG